MTEIFGFKRVRAKMASDGLAEGPKIVSPRIWREICSIYESVQYIYDVVPNRYF